MSQRNSSATHRNGLRARHALWLVVLVAALSSCADTARSNDEQQPATTQIVTQADESQETDTRGCEPGNRAHGRADHRQDRDRSEHRQNHRGPRAGSHDEADENERDEDERDENDNEQDENEQDENDNDD